ncbi:16S rRNA (guanine(527)-N(7))-methyltransferase RsmG [Erythrobacter sp.]|uniref:16S rRNA (guanine(527)-N(7))-methyltransferase RsmG n=1 Tax=Erythrobacter sp. TaxID=1042 RepID=UPI002EBFBEF5|nr:16S rRNA (guanine(527)-N(7))-methyltransferase RsmG [Erythrobacter sp.]
MNCDIPITDEKQARQYVAARCDQVAMERMDAYVSALLSENRQQNLIAKSSEERIWSRHIADSAQLLRFVSRETKLLPSPWMDLGSGPGLPGLVVAIMRPEWPVVLVESRRRRAEFLGGLREKLNISNCKVEGTRLERVEPLETGVLSARAFAPLDRLLRLSAPFSTEHTRYILPKGRSASQDLSALPANIRRGFHVEHSLTNPEAGIIVGHMPPNGRRHVA